MTADHDRVALAEALAIFPRCSIPGRDREGEDAFSGLGDLKAELGHRVAGRHLGKLRIAGEPSSQHDHIDRDHASTSFRAETYNPPLTRPEDACETPPVTATFQAAGGIRAIDSQMFGRERVTSCYLIDADQPTLVETGPTTSVEAVRSGLTELGIGPSDLAHIVVTHIHLDHAGGAGALAPHFPDATVWVHERGARHLADPTKLVASATRVYGEDKMRDLFGPVEPVPENRLRAITDGDRVDLGNRNLDVVYTPGHASHHVALFDSETGVVFVGDALGVFLPDVQVLRPATPPPEFDLELAIDSIGVIEKRQPPAILFSHFGPSEEVTTLCSLAVERLRSWTSIVTEALQSGNDLAAVVSYLRRRTEHELDGADPDQKAAVEDRYELLSSYEMNAMGLMRYIQGRGQDNAARRSATS